MNEAQECPKDSIPIHVDFEENLSTGTFTWSVQLGDMVQENQVLGTIVVTNPLNDKLPARVTSIESPGTGKCHFFTPKSWTIIDTKSVPKVLGYVQPCTHEVLKNDLCLVCLSRVTKAETDASVKVMFAHGQSWSMKKSAAAKLDVELMNRQLKERKLSLVLDLDHTLLHATHDPAARGIRRPDVHSFVLEHGGGQQQPQQTKQHMRHYVKLRPKLEAFLSQVSRKFDLSIYTHGTRDYAVEIAKIIDPDQSKFHQRIVSRTDFPLLSHKSLSHLFPSCDDSMVIILDDRLDVWKENPQNVLLIEPYHFFTGMKDVNNASGPCSTSVSSDDDHHKTSSSSSVNPTHHRISALTNLVEDATYLDHIQQMLEEVHRLFYSKEGGAVSAKYQMDGKGHDVKELMGVVQKTVLKGCVVAFSGVFQVGDKFRPSSHPLWKMAENFGAKVSTQVDLKHVTHLILHRDRVGTEKHRRALALRKAASTTTTVVLNPSTTSPRNHDPPKSSSSSVPTTTRVIEIVDPNWLVESVRKWKRQLETEFGLPEEKPPQPPAPSRESSRSSSRSSTTTTHAEPSKALRMKQLSIDETDDLKTGGLVIRPQEVLDPLLTGSRRTNTSTSTSTSGILKTKTKRHHPPSSERRVRFEPPTSVSQQTLDTSGVQPPAAAVRKVSQDGRNKSNRCTTNTKPNTSVGRQTPKVGLDFLSRLSETSRKRKSQPHLRSQHEVVETGKQPRVTKAKTRTKVTTVKEPLFSVRKGPLVPRDDDDHHQSTNTWMYICEMT